MKKEGRSYLHPQIRTTRGRLVPGAQYLLRYGESTVLVQLLRDRSTDDELKFRLEVLTAAGGLRSGERLTVTASWEGSGGWQLLDYEYSDN